MLEDALHTCHAMVDVREVEVLAILGESCQGRASPGIDLLDEVSTNAPNREK